MTAADSGSKRSEKTNWHCGKTANTSMRFNMSFLEVEKHRINDVILTKK